MQNTIVPRLAAGSRWGPRPNNDKTELAPQAPVDKVVVRNIPVVKPEASTPPPAAETAPVEQATAAEPLLPTTEEPKADSKPAADTKPVSPPPTYTRPTYYSSYSYSRPTHSGRPTIGILVEAPPDNEPPDQDDTGEQPTLKGEPKPGALQKYAIAVEQFGGEPRFIHPDGRTPSQLLEGLHGLIIPGGNTIDEAALKQPADKTEPSFQRFQATVLKLAQHQRMPVRGVDEGMHLMNVVGGGTLMPNIRGFLNRPDAYDMHHENKTHAVAVITESPFGRKMANAGMYVNSRHEVAISILAAGYMPVAVAADQIIEAIQNVDQPNQVGVQWHPEKSRKDSVVRQRFFEGLVADAREHWDRIDPLPLPPPPPMAERTDTGSNAAGAINTIKLPQPPKSANAEEKREMAKQGLKALALEGYELSYNYGEKVNDKLIDTGFRQIDNNLNVRKTGSYDALFYVKKGDMEDFLCSLTPEGVDYVSPRPQEIIMLGRHLNEKGWMLYKNKTFGKEPLRFEIQAAWLLDEGQLLGIKKDTNMGTTTKQKFHTVEQMRNTVDPPPKKVITYNNNYGYNNGGNNNNNNGGCNPGCFK